MRDRRPDYPAYPCIFVGWGNTPRRGADAIIIFDSSPEAFAARLAEIVDSVKDKPYDDRLVLINAWNDWAEGNHLEPDAKHRRGYLEAITRLNVAGAIG